MTKEKARESALYAPIKAYLTQQGYEVKGEIGAIDMVAIKADDEPIVVELKRGFSLTLFHQAIDRQSLSECVYIAVAHAKGRLFLSALKKNIQLCRRLGLGLITVRLADGFVCAHLDPAPYRPRLSKQRRNLMLSEFSKRVGDPNIGGTTRRTLVTAYRQDALRCAAFLLHQGPTKAAHVAQQTGVEKARQLMANNYYGWFERLQRGVYQLAPKGVEAISRHHNDLVDLQTKAQSQEGNTASCI